MSEQTRELEETLDPADWGELRALGHRMVDDMIDFLARLRERPVWRTVPEDVRKRLCEPLPEEPQGLERAYSDFLENVLPYPTGNLHPRFWGWVKGSGTAEGMLAEMLAAGMNCNVSGFDDAATLVEMQVIDWLRQLLDYPADASGLLVSGASMANLVGLAVARNAQSPHDASSDGWCDALGRMVVYGSREMHASIGKATELLGFNHSSLRRIPVNERFEIDVSALGAAIIEDRRRGLSPIAVVGNAGTVNTGAFDDLAALATLCEDEGLWLHVDGAFGVWASLSTTHGGRLRGLSRADSLAFDLHKWLYVPYEAGCCLVRSRERHRGTFAFTAEYLPPVQRGPSAGVVPFAEYGPQLSRGFRALKVWMSIKAYGRRRLARLIDQNLGQARYLAERIAADPGLEMMAPLSLNVVCFRFVDSALSDEELDNLNTALLFELQEDGVAVLSQTRLHDRVSLRAAITNHRSRREDFDHLLSQIVKRGRAIAARRAMQAPSE
jgi:glutamate/tyrosine decarboxylase-like PLP-dependent enzyme